MNVSKFRTETLLKELIAVKQLIGFGKSGKLLLEMYEICEELEKRLLV